MRDACPSQGGPPSSLDRGNRLVREMRAREDKRTLGGLCLVPCLQNSAGILGQRNRFRRAWCLHVVVQADELVLEVHLVPTQREPLAVGSPACLGEEDDGHPKMGWCSLQDTEFLFDGEHSANRSFAELIEVLHRGGRIFRNILPLDGKIQDALQTFKLSIDRCSFYSAVWVVLCWLGPPLTSVVLDHINGNSV